MRAGAARSRRLLAAGHPLAEGDDEQAHHEGADEGADERLRRGQGSHEPDLTRLVAVPQGGEGDDAVVDTLEEGNHVGLEAGTGIEYGIEAGMAEDSDFRRGSS